ncbi:L,D-transpeptidase family protein [Bacillus sp. BGMRC 2118]|nr:L,D-transpeptidase family protein [Bacillus sp. BGMRC 2118]
MEVTLGQDNSPVYHSRKKLKKWYKSWIFLTSSLFIVLLLLLGLLSYYQATHFNTNITINEVDVGGSTVEEALENLKSTPLTNNIYINNKKVFDGEGAKMQFSDEDLPKIKDLLKSQKTYIPSLKKKNYILYPVNTDQYRSIIMKAELKQKLISMNYNLIPSKDAQAVLENGKISIISSKIGTQYDIPALLNEYDKHEYTSDIHLHSIHIKPIMEDSQVIKDEEKKLQEFLTSTVDYKVQDQVYPLKANELIQNAFVTKDGQVSFDPAPIHNKLIEINNSQSTLGKDFSFKTHAGSLISVKGQGYGWALDVEKETSLVQEAFQNGDTSVTASNVMGNGWNKEGYGFETTSNYGIGDTYAEVSINEQRIWLYKEGKLVLTSNVVTGKQSTNQSTLKGVWYILYKRTPYTLTGSTAGNPNYEIEVDYWAPFTNSGQGFHDASWRSNWRSNAYLNAGSGGCVNVPPNVMRAVYNNLTSYQPVVIY